MTESRPNPDPPPMGTKSEAPAEDFAKTLDEFDREHPKPEAGAAAADPKLGTRVKSTVISVGEEMTLVDFGGRSEGAVETKHFRKEDGTVKIGVGDVLDLFVVEAGDQILLAPSVRATGRAALRQVREANTAGMPVTGKVTGVNAGGLAVDVGGVRGFCPLSQIETGF